MFDLFKKVFGGTDVDFATLVKNGAVIVDVRSPGEYQGGHIRNSINIPVDSLSRNLNKIKDKNKVYITCCASGMRSATAKTILKGQGYENVHNGGGWMSLKAKL